ncbi:hypothetical protein XENOCAPTIV_000348 [Xenoophorus captivus]|uniref:Uncharacterized protein n=1 Tax=Xenoophorus captivus TaxID=1517983 RepID=A0ABV0RPQ7_9TELE
MRKFQPCLFCDCHVNAVQEESPQIDFTRMLHLWHLTGFKVALSFSLMKITLHQVSTVPPAEFQSVSVFFNSSGLRYGDGPAADVDPALHWWHQRSVAQPSGGDRPGPCWILLDVLKQMN